MDLLRGIRVRVYPVGRLDYASEGLLLLTNDGELAEKLMKASSHVPKTYVVKVSGTPDESGLEKLRRGLMISEGRFSAGRAKSSGDESSGGSPVPPDFGTSGKHKKDKRIKTAPAKVRLIRESDNPWYEVTMIEGKNRQIRRMFEEIGHHVEKIKRVRYGPLSLDVPPGEFRRLSMGEVGKLRSAAGLAKTPKSF